MKDIKNDIGPYKKISNIANLLIILLISGWLSIIGSGIILPLIFGVFLALILLPIFKLVNKDVKIKWLSILITYLLVIMPLTIIGILLSFQLIDIADDFPQMAKNIQAGAKEIVSSVQSKLPFAKGTSDNFISDNISSLISAPLQIVRTGIISSSTVIISIAMSVLYSFFFLYYKKSIESFFLFQFDPESREGIGQIFNSVKKTAQSYVGGLAIVIVILSVMNSIGLSIIGIKYSIFWGVLAGLLAIIPYIGTLIGGFLPFLFAFATAQYSWQPWAVAGFYMFVQQVEGNLITPKVVGGQVDLNPMVSLFSLILFGTIWGIGGVVLSIPLMSIVKIIFEHVDATKPIAVMMSSEIASESDVFAKKYSEEKYRFKNLFTKKK